MIPLVKTGNITTPQNITGMRYAYVFGDFIYLFNDGYIYKTDGKTIIKSLTLPSSGWFTMCCDKQGNIYVNQDSVGIYKIDKNLGSYSTFISNSGDFKIGDIDNKRGYVYIINYTGASVSKYSMSGTYISTIMTSPGYGIGSLVVDENTGYLYISCNDGSKRLFVCDSNGTTINSNLGSFTGSVRQASLIRNNTQLIIQDDNNVNQRIMDLSGNFIDTFAPKVSTLGVSVSNANSPICFYKNRFVSFLWNSSTNYPRLEVYESAPHRYKPNLFKRISKYIGSATSSFNPAFVRRRLLLRK